MKTNWGINEEQGNRRKVEEREQFHKCLFKLFIMFILFLLICAGAYWIDVLLTPLKQ